MKIFKDCISKYVQSYIFADFVYLNMVPYLADDDGQIITDEF